MSKHFAAIKGLPLLAVLAVVILIANLAYAQGGKKSTGAAGTAAAGTAAAGTPAPTEGTPAETAPPAPPTKPIVHNWKLKKLDGNVNLTINPDGSYDFSGGFKDKKPGDDWDISMAVKSSTGAIIVFHWEGDAANGVQFSKTGHSAFIADDYTSFTSKHTWTGKYAFHLSAAGRRKHYEEMEAKRKKLKAEEEAAVKAKNKKLAEEKKAEAKTEAGVEMKWEEDYEQQHPAATSNPPSSGGGGSSVGSTISSVVSTIGSIGGDIASFF